MEHAVIQIGTPREKRNVAADKDWLEARVVQLEAKKEMFAVRGKAVTAELKERKKQIEKL